MPPEDRVRLQHMRDACSTALRFVQDRQRSDLDHNDMLLFALVRAIEVLGEAAGKVTESTRAYWPHLPWRDIVGMRNRLIHAYFDVDKDILWNTTQRDLPDVLREVEKLLASD